MRKYENVNPLFKYIGGKSWLKEQLRQRVCACLKSNISAYVEPFAGGLGSFLSVYDILLENNIKNVVLSDINPILMHTYQTIQHNPNEFIKKLVILEKYFINSINPSWREAKNKEELKNILKPAETFFNKVKKDFNANKKNVDIKNCARFVFLQKHCFNGVYRENSKGDYNTPFNWSASDMLNTIEKKVIQMHELFNKFDLQFINQSFERLEYNQNTLYYLDPPYFNEDISENKYSKDRFSINDQLSLISKIKDTHFIYSNHKSEILLGEIKKIKNVEVKEVSRKNIMSASSKSRKQDKTEILATKL